MTKKTISCNYLILVVVLLFALILVFSKSALAQEITPKEVGGQCGICGEWYEGTHNCRSNEYGDDDNEEESEKKRLEKADKREKKRLEKADKAGKKAEAFEEKLEWDKAYKAWEKAIKFSCPGNKCSYYRERLNQAGVRSDLFNRMLSAQDNAINLEKNSKWKDAIEYWEIALDNCRFSFNCSILKARLAHARFELHSAEGALWEERKNWPMAMQSYKRAEPFCLESSALYRDCKRLDEALARVVGQLQLILFEDEARASERRGEFDRSIRFWEKVIERCLDDEECSRLRALLANTRIKHAVSEADALARRGDWESALDAYIEAYQNCLQVRRLPSKCTDEENRVAYAHTKVFSSTATNTETVRPEFPEPLPPIDAPLAPTGMTKELEVMIFEDLDQEKIRELESWLASRRSPKALRLGKPLNNLFTGKIDRIDWNIPVVMEVLAEQGLLGDYLNRNIGGIQEKEAAKEFRRSVREEIEKLLLRGTQPASTKVLQEMQAILRDSALATVQAMDEWVLTNETAIKAMERDILPVVKMLAPATQTYRAGIFMATVVLDLLRKRSQGLELTAETVATVLGREIVMDLGQEWFEDKAVEKGLFPDKQTSKTFSEAVMNFYDTEQWKKQP